MTSRRCLLVFTKPPRPGRVKTRLIGALSAAQAAELHEAFLLDLLERLRDLDAAVTILWALEPGESAPDLGRPSAVQVGDDLGERLRRGLADAGARFPSVAAVGSDHPDLPLDRLEESFQALEGGSDLVLGPTEDGGYYVIGCRHGRLPEGIFDGVEWSGPEVFARTRANAARLDLETRALGPGQDVDTPDDLVRLAARLRRVPSLCPRTHRLLESWNRIGNLEVSA